MIGYDFDGVVTTGNYKPRFEDVIITGNTISMFPHVIRVMKELGIACPVYFMPYNAPNNREIVAFWKAEMILKLGCEDFYEDDPVQAQIIQTICPKCVVVRV